MYSQEVSRLRSSFNSGKTRSLSWRRNQLLAFSRMIKENKEVMCNSLEEDLHKHPMESELMEIAQVHNDILDMLENLEERAKPEGCKKSPLATLSKVQVRKEPYGVVLVIGAWNFPYLVTLQPLAGAIAAGNCVVLKPSEVSPATANVMKNLIEKYMDPECLSVFIGGPKESNDLINNHKFDLIFYTGGTHVGRIIMQAAAKTLTPVVLELGGKNPCFIDKSCDLDVTASRVAWGKWSNAGQICVAPDFILCEASMRAPLIDKLKEKIKEYYGQDPKESESYGRIIAERHTKRLQGLLEGVEVVHGGIVDISERYFSPTIVINVREDAQIREEEIFGPILPIYVVEDVDEAIRFMNEGEKSLQLSVFARDRSVIDRVVAQTSSGGITINELLMQNGEKDLPFGGVGCSGIGNYHGKYSFRAFSQERSYFESYTPEMLQSIRYPPYTQKKLSMLRPIAYKFGPIPSGLKAIFKLILLAGLGVLAAYLYTLIKRQ